MFLSKVKILRNHGIQYIKELEKVTLTEEFRGRPEIATGIPSDIAGGLEKMCPVGAIAITPFSIDLGRCMFCGECALRAPEYIRFTNDYRMATANRANLIIKEGDNRPVDPAPDMLRPEVRRLFRNSLKLRQVSAGGDNSTEMELNASGNVNFDFGRFGVDFTASPRHADGLVITGPITENMAVPLELTYNAIPTPKIIILAGGDAISGGVFADSAALDRSFLERHKPDLFMPGNPVHPMTFIDGCLRAFIKH